MEGEKMKCSCPHHKMIPFLMLLLGVLFLLLAFNLVTWRLASIVWPMLVIVGAVTKLAKGRCKCCEK